VYVRDSGIVPRSAHTDDQEQLLVTPVAGFSWKASSSRTCWRPPGCRHRLVLPDRAGAEIDLLLELGRGVLWAVEVKRFAQPAAHQRIHLACEDVKATHRFVVYPGKERYRLDPSTEAIPYRRCFTRRLSDRPRAPSAASVERLHRRRNPRTFWSAAAVSCGRPTSGLNPREAIDAPLGAVELYIGGGGCQTPGYVNIDLFALPA